MPTARCVRVTAARTVSVTIALVASLAEIPMIPAEIPVSHLDLREAAFSLGDSKLAARDGRGLRRRESGETDDGGG